MFTIVFTIVSLIMSLSLINFTVSIENVRMTVTKYSIAKNIMDEQIWSLVSM